MLDMSLRSGLRSIGALVAALALLGALPTPAGAAPSARHQVCYWFDDDKDGTFDCDSRYYRGPVVKPVVGLQCWAGSPAGVYAQQLVRGAWVDRPDIPVTVTEDPFCQGGTTHVSSLHLTLPAAKFALRTFRVVVPESAEYATTYGDPMTVCIRAKSNDRFCT